MARRVQISVEIQGHRELMRKLRAGDPIFAEPWADAMRQIAEVGLGAAQAAAPVGPSGLTKSKLTKKVQARPIPNYVVIKTAATRSSARYKRYPYPKRIEFDPRSRHRLWLTNAIKAAQGRIQSTLNGAARTIESRWNS